MKFYTYIHRKADTPGVGGIFYVGKGSGKRAWDVKGRSRYWRSIYKVHGFLVEIVQHWALEEDAFEHEKTLIYDLRSSGARLVNLTDGGEGPTGLRHSEETKKRISETVKIVNREIYLSRKGTPPPLVTLQAAIAKNTGHPLSDTHRAAIGSAQKGVRKSPEHCAANSAARKGKKLSLQHRANMSASLSGKPHSAAHNAAVSSALTGKKKSPQAVANSVAAKKRARELRLKEVSSDFAFGCD